MARGPWAFLKLRGRGGGGGSASWSITETGKQRRGREEGDLLLAGTFYTPLE